MRFWHTILGLLKVLESYQATIALVAALTAAFVASWQIADSRKAAEAQTYLVMRQRFFEVSQKLQGYEDLAVTRSSPHWINFRNYWYISFDEWYVTQKLGVFPDLWKTYYAEAFMRSLKRKGMRGSFCELRKIDFSMGIRNEFAETLEEIFRIQTGEGLCP